MNRFIYNTAVLLLSIALAANAFAAVTAGMLRSNGGVSVNGAPVTPVTTVFAGDRIETAPKAGGNLTVSSSSLLLEENSSLVFNGQGMDFQCGGGTIQTTQGLASRYGRVGVKPAKDAARYKVQQTGATLNVSALEGDLTLSDGAKNFSVPAGSSMNVPYTGCVQVAQNDTQQFASKAMTEPASPSPPVAYPTTTAGGMSRGALLAPSAVISVAVSGLIAVSHNPISPSGP